MYLFLGHACVTRAIRFQWISYTIGMFCHASWTSCCRLCGLSVLCLWFSVVFQPRVQIQSLTPCPQLRHVAFSHMWRHQLTISLPCLVMQRHCLHFLWCFSWRTYHSAAIHNPTTIRCMNWQEFSPCCHTQDQQAVLSWCTHEALIQLSKLTAN